MSSAALGAGFVFCSDMFVTASRTSRVSISSRLVSSSVGIPATLPATDGRELLEPATPDLVWAQCSRSDFVTPLVRAPVRDFVASLHRIKDVALHAWAKPTSRPLAQANGKIHCARWAGGAAFSPSLAPSVTTAPKPAQKVMTRMHIASSDASDRAGPHAQPTDFTARYGSHRRD